MQLTVILEMCQVDFSKLLLFLQLQFAFQIYLLHSRTRFPVNNYCGTRLNFFWTVIWVALEWFMRHISQNNKQQTTNSNSNWQFVNANCVSYSLSPPLSLSL